MLTQPLLHEATVGRAHDLPGSQQAPLWSFTSQARMQSGFTACQTPHRSATHIREMVDESHGRNPRTRISTHVSRMIRRPALLGRLLRRSVVVRQKTRGPFVQNLAPHARLSKCMYPADRRRANRRQKWKNACPPLIDAGGLCKQYRAPCVLSESCSSTEVTTEELGRGAKVSPPGLLQARFGPWASTV